MELRSNLKDGCHARAKGALPAGEKSAICPITGTLAVTTSKYIDYLFIPTLACDEYRSSIFSSVPTGSRGLSLDERRPGRQAGARMSGLDHLLAERVEPNFVPRMSASQVTAPDIAGGGVAAKDDAWLSAMRLTRFSFLVTPALLISGVPWSANVRGGSAT